VNLQQAFHLCQNLVNERDRQSANHIGVAG
jgi:hypothetical protein